VVHVCSEGYEIEDEGKLSVQSKVAIDDIGNTGIYGVRANLDPGSV
jgi:hypothetical protein